MRPIEKWNPGQNGVKATYNPWSNAKEKLAENLGEYCSFCEKPVSDEALHVEHIQPKGLPKYDSLKYDWNNFLLSCQRCNGPDNKGVKDVIINEIHLPNRNNTALSISYGDYGMVVINPALKGQSKTKAQKLIDLVGLEMMPGVPDYKRKDKRWERRKNIWELAVRYYDKYQTELVTDVQIIVDLAIATGFWSVWYSVFKGIPEILKPLIEQFPGTSLQCFDNRKRYKPVHRNPKNQSDPT